MPFFTLKSPATAALYARVAFCRRDARAPGSKPEGLKQFHVIYRDSFCAECPLPDSVTRMTSASEGGPTI